MNADPNPDAKQASRRRLGCWSTALILLVLLVGLPSLAVIGWQVSAARRVENLQAAIRARGEPLLPQELYAFYVLPAGEEDTTTIWMQAGAPLDSERFRQDAVDLPFVGIGEDEIPPPGQPWPQLAAAETLLDKYQANVKGMHEAARRGGAARFPMRFEDGMNMELDHTHALRVGARLLVLEAHVQAHRGNPHAVAESIRALNCLGDSLEQEPNIISLLDRISVGGMSTKLCCEMVPFVEFSDEDLRRLSDEYRATRYNDGFYRALVGDRVEGIQAFDHPERLEEDFPPVGKLSSGLRLTRNDDLALYLKIMEGMIAAARKPYPQARLDFQASEQRLPSGSGMSLNKLRHLRTLSLVPGLTPILTAATRGNLQTEVAVTAIAIERYRRHHGRLPERLEELVPDFLPQLPVDPFDGKQLRYVLSRDQYLLYSVGVDGVDNGGQAEFESDIVFAVQRRDAT